MKSYLIRRLLATIPVLGFVTFWTFLVISLLPGDAVSAMLAGGESLDPQVAQSLRMQFGLGRPLLIRYAEWVVHLLTGDLGISLSSRRPVLDALVARLPVTLILAFGAILISLLVGIPIGIAAGVRPNSWLDRILSGIAALGVAMPNFWLGILLVMLFAQKLQWLPSFGYKRMAEHGLWVMANYMLLPWITLATARTVEVVRQVRSGMVDIMSQDFMQTARAKGLHGRTVVWKHALRNVLIPVVTVTGMAVGRMFSGAVVIEQVFLLPGLGTLAVDSLMRRDFPVTQGMVLIAGVATVGANLVADLCYGLLDPRIRYD